jgi:O-methyltransferase
MSAGIRQILRRAYARAQTALAARGIYLAIARISERTRPELINRAIWRPLVAEDSWRALYKSTQALTKGDDTDNIFRQCRLYSTFQMASYATRLPAGDVVECGCWHGHSALGIATLLEAGHFAGRFHIFDSFEGGLSDFGPKDQSSFQLTGDEQRLQTDQFRSDLSFVRSVLGRFSFVELHPGWIPETFASFEPRPVRFVHVDVDMYDPTKAALEFFWEALVPGGVMVIDDYNHAVFEGATRAVDEFLMDRTPRLFYSVPFGSAYIIK